MVSPTMKAWALLTSLSTIKSAPQVYAETHLPGDFRFHYLGDILAITVAKAGLDCLVFPLPSLEYSVTGVHPHSQLCLELFQFLGF